MTQPIQSTNRNPLRVAAILSYILAVWIIITGIWVTYDTRWETWPFLPQFLMCSGTALSCISPGAAYVLTAVYLSRRRYWALIASITLTIMQLISEVQDAVYRISEMLIGDGTRATIVYLVIAGLSIAQMLLLGYFLWKSFPLIDRGGNIDHGFEPLIPEARRAEQPPDMTRGVAHE